MLKVTVTVMQLWDEEETEPEIMLGKGESKVMTLPPKI